MTTVKRNTPYLILGMMLSGWLTPQALAAGSTSAIITAGNYHGEFGAIYAVPFMFDSSPVGALADTGNFETNFTGYSSNSEVKEITFSAQAIAMANNASLKTYASLSVTNPLPIVFNSPYVTTDYETHLEGIPEYFAVTATADYNDTVTLLTNGKASYITLSLTTNGTEARSENSDPAMYFTNHLQQNNGPSSKAWENITIAYINGSLNNHTFTTAPFKVIENNFTFGLGLESGISFYSGLENQTYSGTIDFMNSIVITGLQAFDANGNPVPILSAVGSSGYIYVTAVPEPETYAMLLAGLGLVGFVAKRLKSQLLTG